MFKKLKLTPYWSLNATKLFIFYPQTVEQDSLLIFNLYKRHNHSYHINYKICLNGEPKIQFQECPIKDNSI